MTFLGLMTTLAQIATNLFAQFVKIILKILVSYLQDQANPFLDKLGVKALKTTHNNKELISNI